MMYHPSVLIDLPLGLDQKIEYGNGEGRLSNLALKTHFRLISFH